MPPDAPRDDRPPPDIPPVVAWFSRHGVKVILVLIVLELALHGFNVWRRG